MALAGGCSLTKTGEKTEKSYPTLFSQPGPQLQNSNLICLRSRARAVPRPRRAAVQAVGQAGGEAHCSVAAPRPGDAPVCCNYSAQVPKGSSTPRWGARGGTGLVAPGSEAMAPDKCVAGAEQRGSELIATDHVSVGSGTPATALLTASRSSPAPCSEGLWGAGDSGSPGTRPQEPVLPRMAPTPQPHAAMVKLRGCYLLLR